MAEYIEKTELRKAMYHESFEKDSELQRWDSGCWIRYKLFENVVESIPIADVQPVKHGQWIKVRGSWCTPGGDPVWSCSECGKGIHVYGIEHVSYGADIADGQWVACPNCGARMLE